MGLIIRGMDARPIKGIILCLAFDDTRSVDFNTYLDSVHKRFIVKPGTITEANNCHVKVSPAVIRVCLVVVFLLYK